MKSTHNNKIHLPYAMGYRQCQEVATSRHPQHLTLHGPDPYMTARSNRNLRHFERFKLTALKKQQLELKEGKTGDSNLDDEEELISIGMKIYDHKLGNKKSQEHCIDVICAHDFAFAQNLKKHGRVIAVQIFFADKTDELLAMFQFVRADEPYLAGKYGCFAWEGRNLIYWDPEGVKIDFLDHMKAPGRSDVDWEWWNSVYGMK